MKLPFLTAVLGLSITLFSFSGDQKTAVLSDPAKEAFIYLNKVRANPASYSKVLNVNLNSIKPSQALIWDTILAKEAQRKAAEMATQNYFAHVDKKGYGMNYYIYKAGFAIPETWVNDKKKNYVESLGATTEGPDDFIAQLIIDKGVPDLSHRKHLLSVGDFFSKNTHVGIGIAYNPNSTYHYYCCVLIAPKTEASSSATKPVSSGKAQVAGY